MMNISIRNFSWDDMPQVVEIMNQTTPERQNPLRLEDVEAHWRAPYNHPEQDCFVALLPDQHMIGVGIADLLDTPNEANGALWYLQDYPEAAHRLITTTDDYFFRTALQKSPPEVSIWINRSVLDTATDLIQLLEAQGYRYARRFYTMCITLNQPVEPVPAPEGITLRPINVAQDAEAAYRAQCEAFEEHWGYYVTPYEEWIYPTTLPDFDPSLWWVAEAGGEIVGMLLGEPHSTDYGWISILGVRRPWRKKGIALVMLQRAFVAFQQRGITRVELGVDTENENQAVALYERAGMHIANCRHTYRRVLRDSAEVTLL